MVLRLRTVMSFDWVNSIGRRIQIQPKVPFPYEAQRGSSVSGDCSSWHFNQWASIIERQTRAQGISVMLFLTGLHSSMYWLHIYCAIRLHDCCRVIVKAVQDFTHLMKRALLFYWQTIHRHDEKIHNEQASPLCSWKDQWFVSLTIFCPRTSWRRNWINFFFLMQFAS